jgi:hypothetical protein
MKISLFDMIFERLAEKSEYFHQKADGLGRMGFHGKHKCVVAMRMLAYGSIADALDDGYAMAESTVLECVKEFASTVISVFEEDYLRPPNQAKLNRILMENKARGFSRDDRKYRLHALGVGSLKLNSLSMATGMTWHTT